MEGRGGRWGTVFLEARTRFGVLGVVLWFGGLWCFGGVWGGFMLFLFVFVVFVGVLFGVVFVDWGLCSK